MSLVSGVFLIYVLSTNPIISVQMIQKTDSAEACQAQIDAITREEAGTPEKEQIHERLKCLGLSYQTPDEQPKKSPANLPTDNEHSCKNPITHRLKPCLEA